MKIERNINGKPEIEHQNLFGVHCDGVNFYFFESNEERLLFFEELEYSSINEFKIELLEKLDLKTQSLIFEGFTFDNNLFSLSINAQINWSNLLNIPESMFPLNLSTKDDNIYVLTYQNVIPFYLTALGTKNSKLQYGNDLKILIKNATTKEELNNINLQII